MSKKVHGAIPYHWQRTAKSKRTVDIDLDYIWRAMPRLLEGALVTTAMALAAMALSLVLATVLAAVRAAGGRIFRAVVGAYVRFMGGTPQLLQILLVFYALPAFGADLGAFAAGIVALGLGSAASTAEALRDSRAAIPLGPIEAARALALRRRVIWRRIILPQLVAAAKPRLAIELTHVIKGTALVSVIAVVELLRAAQRLHDPSIRALEGLIGAAAIYFVMIFSIAYFADRLERQAERP